MLRDFTNDSMIEPTVRALRELGGSGTISEIYKKVVNLENISEDEENIPSSDGRRNLIEYRLAWARTYLKNSGLLERSARGIWHLTPNGADPNIDIAEQVRLWRASSKSPSANSANSDLLLEDLFTKEDLAVSEWKEELLQELLKMDPYGFERLTQRLLREGGFSNVEVTKRSGDGGIDGVGNYKISFLSFPVFFQCKRYTKSVSSPEIRDFRGSLSGRGEKGLFITTGSFTEAAVKEASRDGVLPIELVDGLTLCDLLKEYKVGVETETIEKVLILPDFFRTI